MMWYAQIAKKFNDLKLAFGGENPAVNIHVQGDTKGGSALVVAIYSRQGTRIASPDFVESLAADTEPVELEPNTGNALVLGEGLVGQLGSGWKTHGPRNDPQSIIADSQALANPD